MITKSILENCFILLMGASFVAWCMTLGKVWRREALVPASERAPVPWNLMDLWLSFACVLGMPIGVMLSVAWAQGLALDVKMEDLLPDQAATRIFAGAFASVIAAIIILAYLVAMRGAIPLDFGFDARWLLSDLKLGLVAFIHLVGPVMLIQCLFAIWWPSQHPIIKLLERSDSQFAAFACIVAAVIVAPVVEEFFFRVVLQGWFERIAGQYTQAADIQSPTLGTNSSHSTIPLWPVVASATIFALMHAGHGPDMFALFVFASGLGYLYRQTHRVLPCIVVHFLLNGWSMFALLSLVRND